MSFGIHQPRNVWNQVCGDGHSRGGPEGTERNVNKRQDLPVCQTTVGLLALMTHGAQRRRGEEEREVRGPPPTAVPERDEEDRWVGVARHPLTFDYPPPPYLPPRTRRADSADFATQTVEESEGGVSPQWRPQR